ncbi:hypothetical protein ACH5RR_011206 [Cinchona calisaya]|uniref:Protein kinase domain-containing protein n=1 Tax=Cinchona calisaya TaxID=153742 RepID=A0ABD3A478_9GENT
MDGLDVQENKSVYLLRNYKFGKTLGSGSFSKVKLAKHVITGREVAIKILKCRNKTNNGMELDLDGKCNIGMEGENVKREDEIMKLIRHPHIVRLYEIICGVECCHEKNVVHRDLKLENILLDSRCNVKIADFGLSNMVTDGILQKTACGSPQNAAPEVISLKEYGPQVDIWSCGVILYVLLCGSLPFDDANIPNLLNKIKGGLKTLPDHISAGAADLVSTNYDSGDSNAPQVSNSSANFSGFASL